MASLKMLQTSPRSSVDSQQSTRRIRASGIVRSIARDATPTEVKTQIPAHSTVATRSSTAKSGPATRQHKTGADPFKNWIDDSEVLEDQKLVAKLRLLQASLSDRKQMHTIICQQRDDWNKLFQGSLRLATISAALLAALSGGMSPGNTQSLTISAGVLDTVAAIIMVAVNNFQPSQLAEEQRTAVRQFGYLYHEVETTLAMSPALREDSSSFFRNMMSKFHALDKAYPLPLTPGGLPKFPEKIRPSKSGTCYEPSAEIVRVDGGVNGWTRQIEEDLLRISALLNKDIASYLDMSKAVLRVNKVLAVSAPAMTFVAGVANFGNCFPVQAALLSIGAFFAGVLSHDMQMGMIFEMYRNCAGYYVSVNESIQRTLRMPVELREDGELFHQRIVHRLGRKDEFPSIPQGAQSAGVLF